ncbi:Hypothetical predicted protein [Octopus vulgaris]|uniref:Uncharacterized protein n=2 Tax=Octopus vulgaris TaxID=6645 RepID=A0AA36BTD4_OCTVU|nr:Hypothetical predicted protein [Octopus vulgaris]
MLAGAYSKRFRKLQEYQIEKLKLLNASYEDCVNRNNEETANNIGKARRLSQETNKRRKVLALRRKQESQREEKRRQEILLHRRLLQQQATERFQRAPLQSRIRKGASCLNTPLEEVLQIIRGETSNSKTTSQTTKPLRSHSAKLPKEVQFGNAILATKPPIHTPSQLQYLLNPSERATLCIQKKLKGMVNNRDLFEQQLRRHQQQPFDQGTSPASKEELSDSDQSISSSETYRKKCKLPSSASNQNTSIAISDHITKYKMPLVGNGNKMIDDQHSLNGNHRTCDANSECNGYSDYPSCCNNSTTKQELPPNSEPSTKWPNHKAAQLMSLLGPKTVAHSAANVKPITAWSSPGNHLKNDKKINGTMENCDQFENYCQMENTCIRDTKWPQNSTADPNNMPLSGGRTWTVSKHNIYERQLSNFSNTSSNISHSSSKLNGPASENQHPDTQSDVALQTGCNSIIHKTTENSKSNIASTCKNTVTNATTLTTEQLSTTSSQPTRQTSANHHEAIRQNSANSYQGTRQNSTTNHQEIKHNFVNHCHAHKQNSSANCQSRWNSTNPEAKHEVADHVTINQKTSKTGRENASTVVVSNQKKSNSSCTALKKWDNDDSDADDVDDDSNNSNNYNPIMPCCYVTPKVKVRKQSVVRSEETHPGCKDEKKHNFPSYYSNGKNLETNGNGCEEVRAGTQSHFTKKNGKSVRSILKHQTDANVNQSAIPFQLKDSLEITRLHYSTNQKENTDRNEKPSKKHVHFAMENILCEKQLLASNIKDKIAGFAVDKPLATGLKCRADPSSTYQGEKSGIVNENQENQYGGRPSAKAFIITQSAVDNDGQQTSTNTCNETMTSGKPAEKKPGLQHITMGKLKNMFSSQILLAANSPALSNISNQSGNKKPASNLGERRKLTSAGEVSSKPPVGIHVDKTPTDEDINLVWQKVKSCFKQNSLHHQRHHPHHPQQQLHVKYQQQQQQQQQLQYKQQLTANSQPVHFNGRLVTCKTPGWSNNLSVVHQNGFDNFNYMEKSDSYLRRLTFLQQKAKQHSYATHNNNNNNNNNNYNNDNNNISDNDSRHCYYDGSLSKTEKSNVGNRVKPVPSVRTNVSESLAAFLTAEDYSKLLNVTDKQMMVAMNHAAVEQQVFNRRQLHLKGPTIISLEEQRLMESLERINNKLKASRITKYQ